MDLARINLPSTVPSQCRQMYIPTRDVLHSLWKQLTRPLPKYERNALVPAKGPIAVNMDVPLYDIMSYKNFAIHVTYFPPLEPQVEEVLRAHGKVFSIADNKDGAEQPRTLTFLVNNGDYIDPIDASKSTQKDPLITVSLAFMGLFLLVKLLTPRDSEQEAAYTAQMAKNAEIGRKEVEERETVSGMEIVDNINQSIDALTNMIMNKKDSDQDKKK